MKTFLMGFALLTFSFQSFAQVNPTCNASCMSRCMRSPGPRCPGYQVPDVTVKGVAYYDLSEGEEADPVRDESALNQARTMAEKLCFVQLKSSHMHLGAPRIQKTLFQDHFGRRQIRLIEAQYSCQTGW